MFCPKCGIKNPENGKFCRSCGMELGNVSAILTGKPPTITPYTVDPRKRGISWQNAFTKTFTGLAFLLVSIILGLTGKIGAENWWFWLLIPGFASLSSGIAQIYQLRKLERLEAVFSQTQISGSNSQDKVLPPTQTDYSMPPKHSIYETEDLVVQPSVTENTTRQLEITNKKA